MKTILLIAPQPFFANRGTPFNVRAMVEGLAELGYGVDLLVFPYGERIEIPGVRIMRSLPIPGIRSVPIGPSWQKIFCDVTLFFSAVRLVWKNDYAAIHGVEEGGVIAGLLAKLKRIPYVFDMDSYMCEQLRDSGFFKWNWLLKLVSIVESRAINGAAAVLTVCSDLSDKARALCPAANIHQIEDFPLESANLVDERIVENMRSEFSIDRERVFLYTGNLESYQGIDLMLESFAQVIEELRSANNATLPRLLLVGGGRPGDPLIEKYRAMSNQLGVAEQVTFTGGRPPEQMGSFMALADVLLSPRTKGGNTPLKLYSYMAAERPIVATAIHSHTQVLNDDIAYLAEPTLGSMAKAMVQVFRDLESGNSRARERARAAKELVDTRYNRREFNRRLGLMYEQLIGASEPDRRTAVL